jgi:hypothetical protein
MVGQGDVLDLRPSGGLRGLERSVGGLCRYEIAKHCIMLDSLDTVPTKLQPSSITFPLTASSRDQWTGSRH